MSWRKTFRSVAAAQRRAERSMVSHARQTQREAARARTELLRQVALLEKWEAEARAAHEVQMYENYLEVIVSLHKDSWSPWNWTELAHGPPPAAIREKEERAIATLHAYKAPFLDRMLGKDKVERARLEQAILTARQEDAAASQHQHAQWEWHQRLATGIVRGDLQAYAGAIEHLLPFEELEELGTQVVVHVENPACAEAQVRVRDAEIVPSEELKLLAKGKVSRKDMAKAKYWALYQDHVCSAALRVARELFALLPVQTAFVHVSQFGLNAATGHDAAVAILSVQFDRARFAQLNLDRLDPSDAVSGFAHRMKFKKTAGFSPIEPFVAKNSMQMA